MENGNYSLIYGKFTYRWYCTLMQINATLAIAGNIFPHVSSGCNQTDVSVTCRDIRNSRFKALVTIMIMIVCRVIEPNIHPHIYIQENWRNSR